MTYKYEPDHSIPPSETLREFIMRWCSDPDRALECASGGWITPQRATELINNTGKPWTLAEAAAVGSAMGPNVEFWQNLVKLHREHQERSKGND